MKRLFSIFVCCSIIALGSAQVKEFTVGEIHTIRSEVLQEERRIAVFTPGEYGESDEKYQVLYVLDGEWNFHFVSALTDKLVSSGDMPKTVVVGINNNNRSKDLTPPGPHDNEARFGGGEKFLNFLEDELQPWVESKYRTSPYSILAGHSFGGLLTLYSMMKKPGLFQAYMALSPSLGRNNEQQVKSADQFFNRDNVFPESLYLAVGNEGGYTLTSSEKFSRIVRESRRSKMRFRFEVLEKESHVSITTAGFMNGLRFLHDGYNAENLPELDEIFLVEAHYERLSEKYGYAIQVPEHFYQKFVKEQIGEGEYDYALFILEKYRNSYPNSEDLTYHLANVYLLIGDFARAGEYFLKLKQAGIGDERIDRILQQLPKD